MPYFHAFADIRWRQLYATPRVHIDTISELLDDEGSDILAQDMEVATRLQRFSVGSMSRQDVNLRDAVEHVADCSLFIATGAQAVLLDVFGGPGFQAHMSDMAARALHVSPARAGVQADSAIDCSTCAAVIVESLPSSRGLTSQAPDHEVQRSSQSNASRPGGASRIAAEEASSRFCGVPPDRSRSRSMRHRSHESCAPIHDEPRPRISSACSPRAVAAPDIIPDFRHDPEAEVAWWCERLQRSPAEARASFWTSVPLYAQYVVSTPLDMVLSGLVSGVRELQGSMLCA